MRIIHVITRFLNAGAEENTLLSCNGQAALGHEVHIIYGNEVAPEKCAELDPRVTQHQINSLRREINPVWDVVAYMACRRIFKKLKPDIVHTHTSKAGVIGRLAAGHVHVPVIIHGVHMLAFEQVSSRKAKIYLEMERIGARYTDAFINVSPGTMDAMLKHGLGDRSQHVFIPSGMNIKRFKDAAKFSEPWQDLLGDVELPSKRPAFIVFVGALEERKRHVEFLQLFRKVVDVCHHAVLLVLGEGEQEDEVRRTIQELKLEKHVHILGFRKDVERFLPLARVGVLPSAREGLARVLIQYTLAGVPSVATHTPGAEIIVEEGVNGFLVPVDEVEAMGEPLLRLLTDDVLHERMAKAAKAKDLSAWGADHMVAEIEKVYAEYCPDMKKRSRKTAKTSSKTQADAA